MDLPGEKLVIRMWETLSEKAIGSWFRPGQIRREGIAGIELKRAELLALAQAEREVREIQSGDKNLEDFSLDLKFSKIKRIKAAQNRIEPTIDADSLVSAAYQRAGDDFIRKEINVASAILHAEEKLTDDHEDPVEDRVNDDWLYRWRDYAGDVGSEDMQRLWGRLLAGEVKKPGTYSLRCMEFLRSLDHSDAKLIEKLSVLWIDGMVWKEEGPESPLKFNELLELDDLGVLSGVGGGGITRTIKGVGGEGAPWTWLFRANKKCLVVKHANPETLLQVDVYLFTNLGRQLQSLGSFDSDVSYLKRFAMDLVNKGFVVILADYIQDATGARYFNGEKISGA